MATTIGTQAARLIEAANQTSMALACMGRLSNHIEMSTADASDWWFPIEVLTELHNARFDELATYLKREVLPIVGHIQKAGK
jgi:hypothetical protein